MPNRAWPAAIARNVARTSSRVTPADDLRLPGAPSRIAASAAAMDRRVLADLERGEVEPERPELPAQLRDLAPGGPAEAVGDERIGDLGELRVELARARRSGRSAAPPRRPGTTASGAAARR